MNCSKGNSNVAHNREIILNNEKESKIFARDFALTLKSDSIVTFTGDLGAGKTFLCQEIIKYFCGPNISVTSPTFNIVQTYQAEAFLIYHFDFYRLKFPDEIYELGIEDALQNNLCLIEWPQIIENMLPSSIIKINIEIIEENKRRCCINRHCEEKL